MTEPKHSISHRPRPVQSPLGITAPKHSILHRPRPVQSLLRMTAPKHSIPHRPRPVQSLLRITVPKHSISHRLKPVQSLLRMTVPKHSISHTQGQIPDYPMLLRDSPPFSDVLHPEDESGWETTSSSDSDSLLLGPVLSQATALY